MSWSTQADENPFADPSVSTARNTGAGAGSRYEDDQAPSWLRGGGVSGPPPPPPPPAGGRAPPPVPGQSAAGPSPADLERQAVMKEARSSPEDEMEEYVKSRYHQEMEMAKAPSLRHMPQVMIYMRVANMGLCILLAVTSVMSLISASTDISAAVLACYLFAFSCILCCFETHLKVVAKTIAANFGFLYNAKGRAIFLIFVGVICFTLGNFLAYISGALMMANAAFNFYVICTYPELEREQHRKDLESEGRDFLRANRGALAQAGAEFARNNPDLVRKGAETAASTYV